MQLAIADASSNYLDELKLHLGFGPDNLTDFGNLSVTEVEKIKENHNSCLAIAQVAQEAIESNMLQTEYYSISKIIAAGPKQPIVEQARPGHPAVLGKWGFYFTVIWNDQSQSDVAITDMFGCEDSIHEYYSRDYARKTALSNKRRMLTERQSGKSFGGKQPRKKPQ